MIEISRPVFLCLFQLNLKGLARSGDVPRVSFVPYRHSLDSVVKTKTIKSPFFGQL
nr:J138 [uncultured bacterium]